MTEEQIQKTMDREAIKEVAEAIKNANGSYIVEAVIIGAAVSGGLASIAHAIEKACGV